MIEEEIFKMFANYGVLGLICLWFMFRMEPLIKNNTKALVAVNDKMRKK